MSPALKLAVAAMLGFLLGLTVGSIWRPVPPDVRVWERRVDAYQQDSVAFERVVSTLHGTIATLQDSARKVGSRIVILTANADVAAGDKRAAKRRADSLTAALATTASAADSLPVVVQALTERTAQADAAEREVVETRAALENAVAESLILRGVINTQDSVIASVTNRLRIADDLLRDRPKTDRCKVLWFDCPSRTVTFVAGAVLGAAGGIYVAAVR